MADSMEKPLRVMLWGHPRSLTTVFEKCISYVDGIQIINEPFATAVTTGPEKKIGQIQAASAGKGMEAFMERASASAESDAGVNTWEDSICSYQWVKDTLEADYPGKKIIFCKDHITGIYDHFDKIPIGFRHTFLIRNPAKTYLSLRKMIVKIFLPAGVPPEMFEMDVTMEQFNNDTKSAYRQILDLIEYLKDHGQLEQNPIIIDADDLQNHPASILRQYCEAVGIPYSDSLLEWEAGDDIIKKNWYISKTVLQGNKMGNYFETAFASSKFHPATDPPPPSELTQDVIRLSEQAAPHYKELYEMRLKP